MRPIWLRKRSYAIQRRLRPMSDEHGGLFSPEYMGRVIDLEFPIMRRYFHLEKIMTLACGGELRVSISRGFSRLAVKRALRPMRS